MIFGISTTDTGEFYKNRDDFGMIFFSGNLIPSTVNWYETDLKKKTHTKQYSLLTGSHGGKY